MRCIETELSESVIELESGINRNMRCIETTETKTNILGETSINRNMRCIETVCFKCVSIARKINRNMRCIETYKDLRNPLLLL